MIKLQFLSMRAGPIANRKSNWKLTYPSRECCHAPWCKSMMMGHQLKSHFNSFLWISRSKMLTLWLLISKSRAIQFDWKALPYSFQRSTCFHQAAQQIQDLQRCWTYYLWNYQFLSLELGWSVLEESSVYLSLSAKRHLFMSMPPLWKGQTQVESWMLRNMSCSVCCL